MTPRIIPRGLFFVQVPENPSNRNAPLQIHHIVKMYVSLDIFYTEFIGTRLHHFFIKVDVPNEKSIPITMLIDMLIHILFTMSLHKNGTT